MRHRPIGIGIQDLAGCFAMMDCCWGSIESSKLNEKIARVIYYHGMDENIKMAEEFGHYETFPGSPASKGLFQMDLWELERMEKRGEISDHKGDILTEEVLARVFSKTPIEFHSLRERMMKHGLYFSTLFSQMPTASSASILGNNESIEPYTQLIGARTVLGGQFMIHTPQLVKDLQEIGMWNEKTLKNMLENYGSIQNYPEDEITNPSVLFRMRYIKNKYLTAFELSQKILADLYLARAEYQCQASSNNVFIPKPTMTSLSAYHTYMHKRGAKTGMYYLRTFSAVKPLCFSINDIEMKENTKSVSLDGNEDGVCFGCHS
jgi:ribonucleoside-diphosphate reductase alpha chain